MAKKYFYEYVKETAQYIDSKDSERASHHNWVIDQEFLNSEKAVSEMNEEELKEFDSHCLDRLKTLDNHGGKRKGAGRKASLESNEVRKTRSLNLSDISISQIEEMKKKEESRSDVVTRILDETFKANVKDDTSETE